MAAYTPRAPKISWLIQALLVVSTGFIAFFLWQYIAALQMPSLEGFARFEAFRQQMLPVPAVLTILLIFAMGIWTFSLHTDLYHMLPGFRRDPQNAMMAVLVPVYNIFGIGLIFSRIIRALDDREEHDHWYALAYRMKVALAVFYAGLSGTIISQFFVRTMQRVEPLFQSPYTIVFQVTALVMVLFVLLGIGLMVRSNNRMLRILQREVST
jgi:hypothetical protein